MEVQNSLRTLGSNNSRIIGNGESGGFELYSRIDEYCVLDFGDATGIGSDLSISLPQSVSKIDINITSTGMSRTWNNIPRSNTYTATELTGTTETLKLNGISGSNYCNAMMYGEVVIKKSGTTVFDGKPCVYGSEVGMYDLVSDTFIAGQGKPFLALNKYGYVMMGGEMTESIAIGDDEVVRMYLGDELIYLAASAPTPPTPTPTSGWVTLTSSLSTSLPITKIRCSAATEYGNWAFSPISGQTLWIGNGANSIEDINDAAHGYPWDNRFYCNDPYNEGFMWVFDNGNADVLVYGRKNP